MNRLNLQHLGPRIQVRVVPKAKKEQIKIEELPDGSILVRIWVTLVPEDGKANQAVIRILAKALGVSKTSLEITQGEKSRDKVVQIHSRR